MVETSVLQRQELSKDFDFKKREDFQSDFSKGGKDKEQFKGSRKWLKSFDDQRNFILGQMNLSDSKEESKSFKSEDKSSFEDKSDDREIHFDSASRTWVLGGRVEDIRSDISWFEHLSNNSLVNMGLFKRREFLPSLGNNLLAGGEFKRPFTFDKNDFSFVSDISDKKDSGDLKQKLSNFAEKAKDTITSFFSGDSSKDTKSKEHELGSNMIGRTGGFDKKQDWKSEDKKEWKKDDKEWKKDDKEWKSEDKSEDKPAESLGDKLTNFVSDIKDGVQDSFQAVKEAIIDPLIGQPSDSEKKQSDEERQPLLGSSEKSSQMSAQL